MHRLTRTLLILLITAASPAFAQTCDVDSVAVRVDRSGTPYDWMVDAFDAQGGLLWTADFLTLPLTDAYYSPVEERVYVLSARDRLVTLNCDGSWRGIWYIEDPPSAVVARFDQTDGSLEYLEYDRRASSGLRMYGVPFASLTEFPADRSPFLDWTAEWDGIAKPWDTGDIMDLQFDGPGIRMTTELYDPIGGDHHEPVDYLVDAATGALVDFPWVRHFELGPADRVTATDEQDALLWERNLDTPGRLALRIGARAPWQGGVVVEGTGSAAPALIRLDAEGNELSRTGLGSGAPSCHIVDVLAGASFFVPPYGPHFPGETWYDPVVVSDPDATHTWVHGFTSWAYTPTIPYELGIDAHDALAHQGNLYVGGRNSEGMPALFARCSLDQYELVSVWLDLAFDGDDLTGESVERLAPLCSDEEPFEAILTSGRSHWYARTGWRLDVLDVGTCLTHDVDGDGLVEQDDLDLVLDHLAGVAPLPAEAECRADADVDGTIGITDAVRIADRIAWLAGGPLTGADSGPSPVGWDVVRAARDAQGLEVQVEFAAETGLRALVIDAGLDGARIPFTLDAVPTPLAVRPSTGDQGGLLLWSDAPDRIEVTLRFMIGPESGLPTTVDFLRLVAAFGDDSEAELDGDVIQLGPLSLPPEAVPPRFAVHAPRPNPFNPLTTIDFELDRRQRVEVAIHDPAGRRVRVLSMREWGPGSHAVSWNGTDASGRPVASGVYFVRFRADGVQRSWKVTLLK